MNDFNKILKEFGNLESWVRFLNEQINDGQEISRGKSSFDKSKEQKLKEAPPEPPGPEAGAEGGMGAGGEMGAVPPVIDPSAAPGSQVTIGNKQIDPEFDNDNLTDEIKISGAKDGIKLRPKAEINQRNGTY